MLPFPSPPPSSQQSSLDKTSVIRLSLAGEELVRIPHVAVPFHANLMIALLLLGRLHRMPPCPTHRPALRMAQV